MAASNQVDAARRRLGPLSGVARRMKLDYFLPLVDKDARILDVGCADGWFREEAERRGYTNVVGIDLEEPADVVGDIRAWRELGLETHSFDAIVAFEVIEHGDFAPTFWKLLRPGGRLLITTPVPHLDGVCQTLERLHLLQERGSEHTHLTDLRELRHFEVERYQVKAVLSQWGVLRARPAAEVPDVAPEVSHGRLARRLVRRRQRRTQPVSPEIYDTDYFLSNVLEGLPEYLDRTLAILHQREVDLLEVEPGLRILDLACGRGETSAALTRLGANTVSLDYSWDAVTLTRKYIEVEHPSAQGVLADAAVLPFPDGSFDRVLMADIIEHLPRPLGIQALREVDRVLRPGGHAVLHTSPNPWFIATVKPVLVLVMRLLRRDEVVHRFAEYDRLRHAMHPNELSPRQLPRLFRDAGLPARTWVNPDVVRSGDSEWTAVLIRRWPVRVAGRIAGAWPFRLVFGNDLYAIFPTAPGQATSRSLASSS